MNESGDLMKTSVHVPDWAHDAIWYQIFPERFRNGAPGNNPEPGDLETPDIPNWRVSPWGQDWYRQDDWEKQRGGFYDSVIHRRFGGDLIGVREKLDYLQDLGINALYLNPVFEGRSLHKYDGSSFHHIDPAFGPDREGDRKRLAEARETEDPATWIWTEADRFFLDFIREVHQRGMRVIIDGVFNHTGRHFFAFRDLLKNGQDSRYRDWYRITAWESRTDFTYRGWFGHQSLPELARTEHDLAPPVKQYVFDCTSRWMDPCGAGNPEEGVDGWRLDVAFCVPHGFWKDWRRHVKSINPEAYLTAEIVTIADEYLRGDEFDAVMNYAWLYPTVSFFADPDSATDAARLIRDLDALWTSYPQETNFVLQNLYDSHDVGRIASVLKNPGSLPVETFDDYFALSRLKHGGGFDPTRPDPGVYDRLRLMVIFQMTYPGAPMIYYGTEVGMWGANDPDCRQPMLWDDISYEPETHIPGGAVPASHRGPDRELFAFYRKAIRLRSECRVLRRGTLEWLPSSGGRVLAFRRADDGVEVTVYLNAGDEERRVKDAPPGRDLWTGRDTGPGPLVLDPGGWALIRSGPGP